jgi:hypothetical protein
MKKNILESSATFLESEATASTLTVESKNDGL